MILLHPTVQQALAIELCHDAVRYGRLRSCPRSHTGSCTAGRTNSCHPNAGGDAQTSASVCQSPMAGPKQRSKELDFCCKHLWCISILGGCQPIWRIFPGLLVRLPYNFGRCTCAAVDTESTPMK